MRIVLIALLFAAHCGGSPDEGRFDASFDASAIPDCLCTFPDLGLPPPPGPGCFAILGGASPARSPARSKNLEVSFLDCAASVCGDPTILDGGTSLPCAQLGDGGSATAACDACYSNVQINDAIRFMDASGHPLVCVDIDTGAPDSNGLGCSAGIGACATQIRACVLDCNADADCAFFAKATGMQSICDLVTNQCHGI